MAASILDKILISHDQTVVYPCMGMLERVDVIPDQQAPAWLYIGTIDEPFSSQDVTSRNLVDNDLPMWFDSDCTRN